MAVTISYDLTTNNNNDRTYIRSMFERFGFKRLGGSVLRYDGEAVGDALEEDWLNGVVPALMFFRSYVLNHGISVRFFTLDTNSVSRIDLSDPTWAYGEPPQVGADLDLRQPTNSQPSERRLRDFVDAATSAA